MTDDTRMRQIFDTVEFRDEPTIVGDTTSEIVARGKRRLRRRRAASVLASATGVAAIATGVAFALPGAGTTVGPGFAGSGSGPDGAPRSAPAPATPTARPSPPAEPTPGGSPTQTPQPDPTSPAKEQPIELPFPETRQQLLDAAVEHFDPEHVHLPEQSTGFSGGFSGGIDNVGTKLSWTIPGEDGMGMVRVAVTGPGYVDVDEYAFAGFASDVGCETGAGEEPAQNCTERELPDGGTAWVAEGESDNDLVVGAVHERADGSLVGVGVFDLFGNNSTVPVSGVDIDVDDALAFVTDPNLEIVADDADSSAADIGPEGEGTARIGSGQPD